ncbi:MAG: hypothetical protein ACKVIB_05640 [Pseudomonadales bacterium]
MPGLGGSIDAHGIAVGVGFLFVNSRYGRVGWTGGNVLLAFKPTTKSGRATEQ